MLIWREGWGTEGRVVIERNRAFSMKIEKMSPLPAQLPPLFLLSIELSLVIGAYLLVFIVLLFTLLLIKVFAHRQRAKKKVARNSELFRATLEVPIAASNQSCFVFFATGIKSKKE